ncbi:MAG: hypothetical protein GXP28_07105 [Planctomycetes bacterium]|nr:hypothetical protein [Planctomycetota bacterium]
MAREIYPREDLLRDARALLPRVHLEVVTARQKEMVFAGFRAQGGLSLYFDSDPVYHFNSSNQLRRAYVEDRLIKAEAGRLVALRRQQSQNSSELLRHEMSDSEALQFCQSLGVRLKELQEALQAKRYTVVGQIPEAGDAVGQVQSWLEGLREVTIADSPRVG